MRKVLSLALSLVLVLPMFGFLTAPSMETSAPPPPNYQYIGNSSETDRVWGEENPSEDERGTGEVGIVLQSTQFPSYRWVTSSNNLNVRRGQSTNHPIALALPRHTRIQVIAREGDWYRIDRDLYVLATSTTSNNPVAVANQVTLTVDEHFGITSDTLFRFHVGTNVDVTRVAMHFDGGSTMNINRTNARSWFMNSRLTSSGTRIMVARAYNGTTLVGAHAITVTVAAANQMRTISWNSNNGTPVADWSRPVGSRMGALPIPDRPGFTFLGWSWGGGSSIVFPDCVVQNTNPTIFAHWTAAVQRPGSPNTSVSNFASDGFRVNWTPPTSGSAPTQYIVYLYTASGVNPNSFLDRRVYASNRRNSTFEGLSYNSYLVRVYAVNSAGSRAGSDQIVRVFPSRNRIQYIRSGTANVLTATTNSNISTRTLLGFNQSQGQQFWNINPVVPGWTFSIISMGVRNGLGEHDYVLAHNANGALRLERFNPTNLRHQWHMEGGRIINAGSGLVLASGTINSWQFHTNDTSNRVSTNMWRAGFSCQPAPGTGVQHIRLVRGTNLPAIISNAMLNDAANAWNGISSNIRVYGPGHPIPAGVTPFRVEIAGILDAEDEWGNLWTAGMFVPILNGTELITPHTNWTTARINMNLDPRGIIMSNTNSRMRENELRATLIHEVGHALKLAHPSILPSLDWTQHQTTDFIVSNMNFSAIEDFIWYEGSTIGTPDESTGFMTILPSALDRMNLRNKWGD